MLIARDVWAGPPGAPEPAVRGASLEMGRGEWLAVTGPNGSGKTTLALAAAGLWPISSGRLEVAGAPLAATAAGRARAGIAVVLQEPASQLFERTVRAEIGFTARNLGAARSEEAAAVSEWSDRLGLSDVLDQSPHTLSAGRQQMVLLAAALASEPRLLVADEAASHLDPEARRRALEALRERTEAGLAVLWITQDPAECRAVDRALVLRSGVLEDCGRENVDTLGIGDFRHPSSPATRIESMTASAINNLRSTILRVRIEPGRPPAGRAVTIGRPVEFTVAPGRPVALLGPNGSGKSVVLEALAGVSACSQVSWELESTPGQGPVLAAQHPELQIFADSVREELAYAATERRGNPAQAIELATQVLVELGFESEFLSRSPWTISAGERRIIQVVSALVTPASAILLDEPTCGLDPGRSIALGHALRQAAIRGPVVVATQDLELPERMAATQVWLGE